MCFRAARKSSGFRQSFWTLVGFGIGIWGVGDLGWTYYEALLRSEPPAGSLIRFLFDTHGMFFVMAIFLNQEKTDSRVETEETLDFIQVGILFFLVYFGTYYLPSLTLSQQTAFNREMIVALWRDIGIIFLVSVAVAARALSRSAKALWRPRALLPDLRRRFALHRRVSDATGSSDRHLVRPGMVRAPALRRILGRDVAVGFPRRIASKRSQENADEHFDHEWYVCLRAARDPVYGGRIGPRLEMVALQPSGSLFRVLCVTHRFGPVSPAAR